MREVHDAHDAEDQCQPNAEKEQQCRLRQGVEALGDEEAEEVHQRLPLPLPEGDDGRGPGDDALPPPSSPLPQGEGEDWLEGMLSYRTSSDGRLV